MKRRCSLVATVAALISGIAAWAADTPPPFLARVMAPMVVRPAPSSRIVVTRHVIRLGDRTIAYRAIVTEQPLAAGGGRPTAVAVSYAYLADMPRPAPSRPVMFIYNGGPGASSFPLHLHGIGPRRIVGAGADAHIVDNPGTLLDVADLVFVDPVGTGASMPVAGRDASGFWSIGGDARAMIDLIARWCAANGRSASPKILVGESYGTMRTAAILKEDAIVHRIAPVGVVLLSLSLGGGDGPVMKPVTLLPSYAAAAWYHHHRVPVGEDTPERAYREGLAFAQGDYASALIKGSSLPAAERQRVAMRVSRLIGLPAETIDGAGLAVDKQLFMASLLGGGVRVGQLDSRVTRPIDQSRLQPPFDDPSMALGRDNSDIIARYLASELGYRLPSPYRSLNLGINAKWRFEAEYGDAALTTALSEAMRADPRLRLFTAGGLYDLTTPVYAGEFALDHADIPPERRVSREYATGHSILEDDAHYLTLTADLRAFVQTVVQ